MAAEYKRQLKLADRSARVQRTKHSKSSSHMSVQQMADLKRNQWFAKLQFAAERRKAVARRDAAAAEYDDEVRGTAGNPAWWH